MLLQENMASGAASITDTPLVHTHHFQQALQRVAPSVSKKDQKVYDALRWQLRSSRSHLNPQVTQMITNLAEVNNRLCTTRALLCTGLSMVSLMSSLYVQQACAQTKTVTLGASSLWHQALEWQAELRTLAANIT